MATKQIGKLKLHWSKRGVAFKWGDGEIHRLSFERKRAGEDSQGYDQAYGQAYSQDYGQGGGVASGQGYGQDFGQGYDQGYEGNDYYDQNQREPSRYDVLYRSDWVMYALLVLLPPLGIWILWKRERFTPLIRGALSALSAVWFVLLLVWLFSWMFAPVSPDPLTQGTIITPPTVTTQPPAVSPSPAATEGLDLVTAAPAATPRTSGVSPNTGNIDEDEGTSGTTSAGTTYVYASSTGTVYHKTATCTSIKEGESVSQIDVTLAISRDQTACPVCYPSSTASATMYYVNSKNKYYHKAATCGNLKNLEPVTKSEAEKRGKEPCATCVGSVWATRTGKYYHKTSGCSGMKDASFITVKQATNAGKTKCPVCYKTTATTGTKYYSTPTGKYYHSNKTCGGMKGATAITAAVAKKRKQTACPVCVSTTSSSTAYYATKAGKYYHTKSNCSGMKNATKVSLAAAKKNGKTACPTCVKTAAKSDSGSATYYATSAGTYYHKTATCSGMSGAKKVTKAAAEKNGKKPCPACLQDLATTVYATSGGKYYHKTATCSGMKNASKITLASAKNKGKTACPVCYKSQAANTIYYYATKAGRYYHKTATCSGMKNATKITLTTALKNGKTACPTCLKATSQYYYATKSGRYYHAKSNCSGMKGASKVTLAVAQKAGKTPCPTCLKKQLQGPTPTPTPKVYCYASTGSRYYHKDRTCSGLKNLKKVLLSVAKSKSKVACPVCVTKKVKPKNLTTSYADKQTVCYAATSSAYYHQDKDCVSGLKKTTVAAAKKKGRTACPSCAKNLKTYVYVTRSGTKYHRKSTCSGTINAYKVSLNTALKLNYVRCTKCNAPKKG